MLETSRVSADVPYRGAEGDHDELYDVPIRRFSSLDELTFDADEAARYSIHDSRFTLPFDVLFSPREHNRMIVGLHGAENTRFTDSPKFQFVRPFAARSESALFLADPTILQSEAMGLGWMAGNRETPVADIMVDIIKRAATAVGASETMLVGHSAGGFAAVLLGSRIARSHAVAINGQSVVGRYYGWTVEHLRAGAFPECPTVEDMLSRYAERLDLRVALKDREPTSTFTWYAHVDDRRSFGELPHFPLFAEHFGLDARGGYTSHGDAFVPSRWTTSDPSVHALPGSAMPFVEAALGEPPNPQVELLIPPLVGASQASAAIPIGDLAPGGANAPNNQLSTFERVGVGTASRLHSDLEDGTPLEGLVVDKGSDTLVVSLHGAVNRKQTVLPRFERLRMLLDHDVSSLFFGDPTLHVSKELLLAWYTGTKQVDVHHQIADATKRVAEAIGAKRIIFSGSSGGGFAALQVASHLPGSIALAFNAQTDIAEYRVNAVSWGVQRVYVETVWPDIWSKLEPPGSIENGEWVNHVDDRVSAVRRYSTGQDTRVYIVQNIEEFHYEEHFLPFLKSARAAGNDVTAWTNREGTLHNPPRAETFNRVLTDVLRIERSAA